jgi:hypothetical protein
MGRPGQSFTARTIPAPQVVGVIMGGLTVCREFFRLPSPRHLLTTLSRVVCNGPSIFNKDGAYVIESFRLHQ